MRVVATAGHVDHGKSTLVLALTGTDPDRFPEEKARGLTIDLGFAFATLPSGTDIGFVDVPGHTRFIKNMLAGVGAVDVAMLIVAANEGWKPQSEEHVRILDLLNVRHGIVVVTKSDLVDAETLEIAILEVDEHVAGTSFEGLEIVTCAARSGRGLDDVRAALDRALASAPSARNVGRPRLWIDRVFAAKGAGTIVTGTLTGGAVNVDDDLDAGSHRVRVRGIESHGTSLARGEPGSRVALNLAGVDHHELTRGDAVIRADQWRAVVVLDVELTLLPGVELRRRGRLTAAVGSGEHRVWCRRLDDRFARLRFATAIALAPGDRIVLRDPGTAATVAGATVVDVTPVRKAREAPARLELSPGARLLADGWLPVTGLDTRTGLTPDDAVALVTAAGGEPIGEWIIDPGLAAELRDRTIETVAAHHRDHPDDSGIALSALGGQLGLDIPRLAAVLTTMPLMAITGGLVHVINHSGRASNSEAARTFIAALEAAPFAPPAPEDLALAKALAREGAIVELDGIFFALTAITAARDRVIEALRAKGSITIADARDTLGSTRKYVVPLMTSMDREGVTRRRGDDRIPGPRSGLLDTTTGTEATNPGSTEVGPPPN